jgi:hypothetical protein
MSIPSIWLDALSKARVCTPADAKRSLRRLSGYGVALREACVLLALTHCRGRAAIDRVERLTSINASAVFATADSLACKGYATIDRDERFAVVTLTDKGRAFPQ